GIALLCAIGQAPALAATINVGGSCTLVDAITAANTSQPTGGCPAGSRFDTFNSGEDTITLPVGNTQTLRSANNFASDGPNGLPVVSSAIVIDGNGSTIARDPTATPFRIFKIGSNGDLTLHETTITGGRTNGGEFATPGGGILNDGTLTLIDSTVSHNSNDQDGGGLRNTGSVTIANSTISGNSVGVYGSGGGVSNSGTLTLANSTVSGNSAVSSNGSGGGVHNTGTMVVTNSTISANSAVARGGGLYNGQYGNVTLLQTSVSGNSASSQGREIFNRTIFPSGTVIANAFNLFGQYGLSGLTGFTAGAIDTVPSVGLSSILDPTLTDNGGVTKTHALVSASPAIDAVPAASCATTGDQRGVARPQDGDGGTNADCDIGAFELQAPPPPPSPSPPPPLPPPAATAADQDPRVRCVGFTCRVLIKCDAVQGSTEPCNTRVDVFIRASALRLAEDGAAKARRRIRFAGAAATNIPPGGTTNLRLTLTRRGQQIVRTSRRNTLRGVMEIRNSVGPVQT
ncbi:MAG: choice-of-anchor Q domain-containing protein, partial [bacterium]